VIFRRLFATLFAVAMMVAPLAMPGAPAMAAPMPSHHGEMAMAEHCGGNSSQEKPGKAVDHGCCTAMCVGIAIAPAAPGDLPAYAPLALRPSADQFHRGYLGEIATPPPRTA
jgi:hypothetical protein